VFFDTPPGSSNAPSQGTIASVHGTPHTLHAKRLHAKRSHAKMSTVSSHSTLGAKAKVLVIDVRVITSTFPGSEQTSILRLQRAGCWRLPVVTMLWLVAIQYHRMDGHHLELSNTWRFIKTCVRSWTTTHLKSEGITNISAALKIAMYGLCQACIITKTQVHTLASQRVHCVCSVSDQHKPGPPVPAHTLCVLNTSAARTELGVHQVEETVLM
jgi:hypothetical protein